jgi:ATP synthase protein I
MRAALLWQLTATAVIASVASFLGGAHAAVSAVLGGGTVIVAGAAYALVVSVSAPRTAGGTIRILLRAEAIKVGLIVLQLWLVFTSYHEVMPLFLVGTLIVTVLLWPVALLYRD